jgi:hypothetical protein
MAQTIRHLILIVIVILLPASRSRGEDTFIPQHGLKVEIFEGRNFEKLHDSRVDARIEHFWDWGSPHENVPKDNFSIRWNGWIRAPRDGRYKLQFTGNDGVRVTLDGARIVDEWHDGDGTYEASVELTEKPQRISVEYFEHGLTSWMVMHWQPVGAAYCSVVPTEAFFPDEESAKASRIPEPSHGLSADYFDRRTGRKLLSDRIDRSEGMWQNGAALAVLPDDAVARYSGYLSPRYSGKHKLIGFAHDNLKVWIDNQPVLNAGPKSTEALIDFEAHKPVAVRMEFTGRKRHANFYLHWVEPFSDKEISIPPALWYVNKAALPKK